VEVGYCTGRILEVGGLGVVEAVVHYHHHSCCVLVESTL
jgi:hypothetical protein